MNINFRFLGEQTGSQSMAEMLAAYPSGFGLVDRERKPPAGYESFVCVDVLGSEFVWMNETFSREKFTWYLWFESIFLVPEDMATFLALRWSP